MQKDESCVLDNSACVGKLMMRTVSGGQCANGWKIDGKAFGESFSFRRNSTELWLMQL